MVVGAVLAALLVKTFLFQAFRIPSESMVPTLLVGDRVLVNKVSYKLHDVNRGDVVVFTLMYAWNAWTRVATACEPRVNVRMLVAPSLSTPV